MGQKIRVAALYGGNSPEHEVSISTFGFVDEYLDRDRFELIPVYLKREGATLADFQKLEGVDVVFPCLHGPMGEDGTIQGACEFLGIPCVGAGTRGSVLCMDKVLMKTLLKANDIPTTPFDILTPHVELDLEAVLARFDQKCVVKPANMGSSVGISRAFSLGELERAIVEARQYDQKVVIEKLIEGREFEVAVLQTDQYRASLPGEIIPKGGFYSYANKYLEADGAQFVLPAKISDRIVLQIQQMAIKACKVLESNGMARVDFFLADDGKLLLNEVNTLPGMTSISLFPKLWDLSGISYSNLLTHLVESACPKLKLLLIS
ncbi:MAG: D-alanine--D-alanine ligase A [Chlamydiia bacterium]|nr:D-alanine--D-alanine ligase A [Chlamydiia bacterium]